MPVTSEKSITNALVKMLPKLWARSKKFYNDKQFKVESELGVVFKDYLEYSYEKYSDSIRFHPMMIPFDSVQ